MDKLIYDKSTRTIRSSLLDKERAAHLATLKRVEWLSDCDGYNIEPSCPVCLSWVSEGHTKDCQIAADIKRLEEK